MTPDSDPEYYEQMTVADFYEELFTNSDLSRVTQTTFDQMLKDEDLLVEIAGALSIKIHQKFKIAYDLEDIKHCLQSIDKQNFVGFRDGKVTLNQMKARAADRKGLASYKVLDDIYEDEEEKKKLQSTPHIADFLFGKKPTKEDYEREIDPWQSNPRCMHSMSYDPRKDPKWNKKRQLQQLKTIKMSKGLPKQAKDLVEKSIEGSVDSFQSFSQMDLH